MSDDLPNVSRPRGSAWRHLQNEGILWEGQVLVPGEETDLAALLVVTEERIALIRGGAAVLDVPRDWLVEAPQVRRTGTVNFQILPTDAHYPESIRLIVREGRLAAAELVELLSSREQPSDPFPTWDPYFPSDDEPIFPTRAVSRPRTKQPNPVEVLPAAFDPPSYLTLDDDDFPPIAPPPDPMPDWSGNPRLGAGSGLEPEIPVIPRINEWNLKPLAGMDSRETRTRRRIALRVAALALMVVAVAAFQSGLLPSVSDVRARLRSDEPPIETIAQVTATTQPEPTSEAPAQTAEPTEQPPSSTKPESTQSSAEETSVELGVGGGEPDDSAVDPEPTPTDTPVEEAAVAPSNAVIAPPEATETPELTAAEPTAPSEPTATEEPAELAEAPIEEPSSSAAPAPAAAITGQVADSGQLQLVVDDVAIGASLPDLTLGPLSSEEWVVVTLNVENTSQELASISMDQFRLNYGGDPSVELPLDSVTGAVSTFLNMSPQLGPSDTQVVSPGDRQQIVLVFAPPSGASDLTLIAGEARIPLQGSAGGQQAALPEMMLEAEPLSFQSPTAEATSITVPRYLVRSKVE